MELMEISIKLLKKDHSINKVFDYFLPSLMISSFDE